MSPISVKINSKHQIAVPSAIRKELDLEAGDRLLAQVRDGVIVLVPERGSAVDQLRGLHREIWEGDIETLTIVHLDARVARIGAELRAMYGLRTPDALQIAACLAHGAEAFVTNDRRLRRVSKMRVMVLEDFS